MQRPASPPADGKTPAGGPAWHTLTVEEALRAPGVDPSQGLTDAEAADRRARYAYTAANEELGKQGLRVMATARRDLTRPGSTWPPPEKNPATTPAAELRSAPQGG